mmetsp:Transcript_46714/g.84316  ORF Transcript_46714/g.84316 Transcript_46714/m.84316 type:complete len:668 (+) Transcript_46714:64-2067(+)
MKHVNMPRPPKTGFDDARPVPKFLQESSQARQRFSPREVPRGVAISAAATLAVEPAMSSTSLAHAAKGVQPSLQLRTPREAERRTFNVRSRGYQRAQWPPAPAQPVVAAQAVLPLEPAALDESCAWLSFGDAVQLLLPPCSEGASPAALTSCVAPSLTGKVGPEEAAASDAMAEEKRLAEELAASGRKARDFVAVTAAPLVDEQVTRRSVWEVFRANHLDGFSDDVVHYGQHLRLGQRPVVDQGSEVLLSCEPPSRASLSAPYLALGRQAGFGYPDANDESRRYWDTTVVFAPSHKVCCMGDPVDLRYGVRIVPLSPFSYLHGQRVLRPVPGVISNGVGRGCCSRTVKVAAGRELLLHAALPSTAPDDDWWIIERLTVPEGDVEKCDQERRQIHMGRARALLGRSLGPPPAGVRYLSGIGPGRDTPYARWEHLRSAIFKRLAARGDDFVFTTFRKVLSKDRELDGRGLSTNKAPAADEAAALDEQILVPLPQLVISFLDFGLDVSKDDLELLSGRFRVEGKKGAEQLIDVDLFADDLRGDTSPARRLILHRLYSRLQEEAKISPKSSLTVAWARWRLESATPTALPGVEDRPVSVEDVMNALPLLRTHSGITRPAFVRWNLDLCIHIPTHAAFLKRQKQLWGALVERTAETLEEQANWSLPFPRPVC